MFKPSLESLKKLDLYTYNLMKEAEKAQIGNKDYFLESPIWHAFVRACSNWEKVYPLYDKYGY